MEMPPQIIDGRTMIPLRAIAEATGAMVAWHSETRTAHIMHGEQEQEPEMTQDERIAWFEQEIFRLVNEYRVENGLHPLVWHDTVALAARLHSEDVATNIFPQTGTLSHTGSDGSTPGQRVTRLGVSGAFGENMALRGLSTPPGISGWQSSPGHRRTMMEGSTHAGVGVGVDSDGRAVITMKFGILH
jgi:uncharacterized protein YkwD